MRFADFLRGLHRDFGADNEFLVLCIGALAMLLVAAYLLLSRRSFWHTLSGVVIAVPAVLYLLNAAEVFRVGGFNYNLILDRVAQFIGLT